MPDIERGEKQEPIEAKIQRIRTLGSYANGGEIDLMARYLECPIHVYQMTEQGNMNVIHYGADFSKPPVRLAYVNQNHYWSL